MATRGSTGEPNARPALQVAEGGDVDILVRRIEARGRPNLLAEGLDRIRELRVAAVRLRAGIPDVERRRRPSQRSAQRRELVVAPSEQIALERAAQIASGAVGFLGELELPV